MRTGDLTPVITAGRQVCGSLEAASRREWLVTDGLGGYAMGTVSGLRTRRYHGLLVVATEPPIGRRLALASLDPVVVIGDERTRLATHEWADGTLSPAGYRLLSSFTLRNGIPCWRWDLGEVVIERELAMVHGRPAVGIVHRVVRTPRTVRLELEALCTWRDVHGERFGNGPPAVEVTADGFTFEGAYRVSGPGFEPDGSWYRGVRAREEAARGLNAVEDLWYAGRFAAELDQGEAAEVAAWAGDLASSPPTATAIIAGAADRARVVIAAAGAEDEAGAQLALAADQLVVEGPTVVAGYPWFGDWSRDTMTSYEGLLLATGRVGRGTPPAAPGGGVALGGDAGEHGRRRRHGVQHRRRHAVVPARGRPSRCAHWRRRPGGGAGRRPARHRRPPPGRHPLRDPRRSGGRPPDPGCRRVGPDVDGRPGRRPPDHAAVRQAGRGQRPVDQRPGRHRRPPDARGPGQRDRRRRGGAGPGVVPDAVPIVGARRAGRRASTGRPGTTGPCGPTSSWPPRSPTVRWPTPRSSRRAGRS